MSKEDPLFCTMRRAQSVSPNPDSQISKLSLHTIHFSNVQLRPRWLHTGSLSYSESVDYVKSRL
jgi:hypothetical protein